MPYITPCGTFDPLTHYSVCKYVCMYVCMYVELEHCIYIASVVLIAL